MNIHGKLHDCKGKVPAQFEGRIGLNITKLNSSEDEHYFENWDCNVDPPTEKDGILAQKITDELAQKLGCKVERYCDIPAVITVTCRA